MGDDKKILTVTLVAILTLAAAFSLIWISAQASPLPTVRMRPSDNLTFQGRWSGMGGYGSGVMAPQAGRPTPYGCGMGHGMMDGWHGPSGGMGWGMGCPMMGVSAYSYPPRLLQPLSIEEAVKIAEGYLASLGNPDLAVEEIEEYTLNFYVLYYERSTGMGAFEMLIDKYTGNIYPEPGPNMMWNTKYGAMGRYWAASSADMPITRDQAVKIAQNYLDLYLPGATVEDVHALYGYYTVMIALNGQTYGMLSVNGYSGQIWYHTWHGLFVQEIEVE